MREGHGESRPPSGALLPPGAPRPALGQRLLGSLRRMGLLTRFTVVGLSLTSLIGLVLGVAVGRQLELAALTQAAERAAETVRSEIDPFLRREDFAALPSPDRSRAIDRHVVESLHDNHIVKIKIWSPAGVVVYSTDPTVTGQQFPIDAELAEALRGEIGMDVSSLSKEENRMERGRYGRLMEIYVPIRLGGNRIMGAYEVYLEVDHLLPMIATTRRFLWGGLALGLGALYLGLFGVVRGASRRLHWQSEELGRLVARREVDRLTTEFVSMVSHELRTPLTALVGFSELLLTRDVEETERREWTENMHAAAKRLSALVEDLLDVSRIEEGRIELKRRAIDVRTAVDTVLADFRTPESSHHFEERYSDSISPVLADPDKLIQILTNLISNAVKYSPNGGPISISVGAGDGRVRLSVADQGLGLPPEELPHIFERFHRIQDEARRKIHGTGLGLYITKRLVELQDGRIWAESEGPNRGATFHVELPAASGENDHV